MHGMNWRGCYLTQIKLVLDANVWVFGLFQKHPHFTLLQKSFPEESAVNLIIDSYGVVETLHVVRRVAKQSHKSHETVEKAFWSILNQASCTLDFEYPLKKDLKHLMRNKPEFLMLARIFDLEPKDVPYLVLSFKHQAILVTEDYRSLYARREQIKSLLKVEICSVQEILLSLD